MFGSKNLEIQYSISKNDIDNWRNTKSEEINLVNPDYGTYNIKVRAKTLSSNFSKEIKFTLVITHPAWATWWFALSVLCLLAFIIIVIVRYRLKLALRRNAIEHQREIRFVKSEYKALNALMNPHFIFNTLNNVQSLVNKDEKRAANEYLRIFANLIRQNMHNTSLELISLEEETDLVNNYLKLEKLRFKDLLNYEIVIDEHVDTSEIMIPPMLIQPLVENAIKHGIFPRKSTDSKIVLEIYERNDELCIVVKDNGIGMAEAQKRADPEHKSFGLDNIRKRLRHVSMIQDRKINLDIGAETDGHNQSWTIVTITIDLSESNKDQQ